MKWPVVAGRIPGTHNSNDNKQGTQSIGWSRAYKHLLTAVCSRASWAAPYSSWKAGQAQTCAYDGPSFLSSAGPHSMALRYRVVRMSN